ncbi:uncharacterized protein K452DRAFT_360568 [Aplosporella prunicola CBS 121167]|uniref:Myb-like domain-containing protein n=1 Tax=Aplosporella prunicola CBS 121167 TaxID=1176127 RepID=A0A6A6B6Q9_9PEZI|nr:uncharacterized protein K452DRAFT_360568 [Aplosporella prunicola CBS 121167]KAF2139328.1 hypothetical protein K452DRAFT_360568 [Aplosporella prunicola CBS 121167]
MADRSRSVRSSSRQRATPQPTAAVRSRTTRSQSRDLGDKQQKQHPARPTRKGTRAASVESTGSVESQGGRATRASRRKEKIFVGDLSVVEENAHDPDLPTPTVEDNVVHSSFREATPANLRSYDAQQSPGAHSSISTAQTVHDPSDLDPLLMAEFIEDLYRDSAKVLSIIAPSKPDLLGLKKVVSEIRKPGSRTGIQLDQRVDRLAATRENFGDSEYISVPTALTSFAGTASVDELPGTFRRPDAILYKANIAHMANRMIHMERDNSDTSASLIRMDSSFPRDFLSNVYENKEDKMPPAASALADETFKVALEIRTQLAITLLSENLSDPDFDPEAQLAEVFYTAKTDSGIKVRGWEVEGLRTDEHHLPKILEDTVRLRVQTIRKAFPTDKEALQRGEYVDVEQLEAEFPWADFIVLVLDWVRTRNAELDNEIEHEGGLDEVCDAVRTTVDPSATPHLAKKTSSPIKAVVQTESQAEAKNVPPEVVGTLKKRLARISDTTSRPVADIEIVQPQEDPQVLLDDDEGDDSRTFVEQSQGEQPPPSSEYTTAWATLKEKDKQNKENVPVVTDQGTAANRKSFIDPQTNAQRVEFEDTPQPEGDTMPKVTGKRQRAESESEYEDDDEGFELDTRAPNEERRKAAPVSKRVRIDDASPSSIPNPSQDKQRTRTPSVAPVTNHENSEREGKQPAGQLTIINRSAPARKRREWTQEETNALYEGMKRYGNLTQPWKAIKDADKNINILANRDVVALKDKARNICKTCDMGKEPRPEGFGSLNLGAFYEKQVKAYRRAHRPSEDEE